MLIRLRETTTGEQARITVPDGVVDGGSAAASLSDLIQLVLEAVGYNSSGVEDFGGDGEAESSVGTPSVAFRLEPEGEVLRDEVDCDDGHGHGRARQHRSLADHGIRHGTMLYYEIVKPGADADANVNAESVGDPHPKSEPAPEPEIAACPMCFEQFPVVEIPVHVSTCAGQLVECPVCSLQLPQSEMEAHEDGCGSRTEQCEKCNRWVMLRDWPRHGTSSCAYPPPAERRADPRSAAEIRIDQIRAQTLGDFFYDPVAAPAVDPVPAGQHRGNASGSDGGSDEDVPIRNRFSQLEFGSDGQTPPCHLCAVCGDSFSTEGTLQRHVLDSGHADFETLQALGVVYGELPPSVCRVVSRAKDIIATPLTSTSASAATGAAVTATTTVPGTGEDRDTDAVDLGDGAGDYGFPIEYEDYGFDPGYDVITDIPCEICGDAFSADTYLEHQVVCEGEGAGRVNVFHGASSLAPYAGMGSGSGSGSGSGNGIERLIDDIECEDVVGRLARSRVARSGSGSGGGRGRDSGTPAKARSRVAGPTRGRARGRARGSGGAGLLPLVPSALFDVGGGCGDVVPERERGDGSLTRAPASTFSTTRTTTTGPGTSTVTSQSWSTGSGTGVGGVQSHTHSFSVNTNMNMGGVVADFSGIGDLRLSGAPAPVSRGGAPAAAARRSGRGGTSTGAGGARRRVAKRATPKPK